MYMLDTNTISYFFRQNPNVVRKFQQIEPQTLCISSVTAAELMYGAQKRQNQKLTEAVNYFLQSVTIYDWDYKSAQVYADLRAKMEKRGQIMGAFDQMIAAHALSLNLPIITSDKAFLMVDKLVVENWMDE